MGESQLREDTGHRLMLRIKGNLWDSEEEGRGEFLLIESQGSVRTHNSMDASSISHKAQSLYLVELSLIIVNEKELEHSTL